MNLEQRNRIMQKIRQLEGLLAWAKAHGEQGEVTRIHGDRPQNNSEYDIPVEDDAEYD